MKHKVPSSNRNQWFLNFYATLRQNNTAPPSLSLSLSFSVWRNSPTQAYVALSEVSRSYKIRLTHPTGRWSARRRGRYPHNTQQTQESHINALIGIRNRDPSNRAASDVRLGPRGHRDWQRCPNLTPVRTIVRSADRMPIEGRTCGPPAPGWFQ